MISPLTVIHPDARIGENVKIDAFTTIYGDVEIGDGTWVGPNVTIFDGARIGKNCRIFPGSVISAEPQDLKFKGEITTAVVGDNTTIRECVTINKGTSASGTTKVGSNCLLMAYVHIAHDCMVGNNCILANGVTLAGHIDIDDFAIIGGLSAVHQFVHIGKHVMISGGSLVRKDVPPFTTAAREPLSFAGINSVGLRRRGFDDSAIATIQEVYRILFTRGINTKKAVEAIRTEITPSTEREDILAFIDISTRGLMKGYSGGDDE